MSNKAELRDLAQKKMSRLVEQPAPAQPKSKPKEFGPLFIAYNAEGIVVEDISSATVCIAGGVPLNTVGSTALSLAS